ncbi:hypothetical protein SNOG_03665 [Parastagonospora nodorum SN15]|uniref:Pre-mRNA-splicing factor n=1 Tax=Phaeosphaeria nodorum (strain SN15 / ATCC MYA-4574 / FGSC 10173) TaxID=321614 RepID=Q0UX49_PHANO|nr:hypothetical protein SNOG_03665 [Parastagonospora nodorum SN15]EAT88870.2 hypothetical protein SNOG_03665 [Parastagonospora nodorum SN15]
MAAPKEGGFKMSLGGLKGKVGLKAAPAKKDVKRPRLALGDDEEDDSGKQQEISGWDAAEGGAVDVGGPKEKEAPRVIPALPNRNWREDARRRQLAKAPHTKAQNTEVTEQMEQPQIQYGLTILKKEDQQDNAAEEEPAPAEPMEDVQDNLTEEQRLEKKALDALINGKPTDEGLVIPLHNDEDAFQSDLRSAPDAPTLDAYEATPIEGFGAALLRGMGWKDSDAAGKNGAPAKIKQVKPRPALLGIGAKEDAAAGVELGDFKGNRGKGKNKQQSYNPVALRNKKTGEVITEDELKAKLEQQDMVQEEPKRKREDERRSDKERDRRRGKDDYDDRRDRRKDKYRDEEYDKIETMIMTASGGGTGAEMRITTASGDETSDESVAAARATRSATGTAVDRETRSVIATGGIGVAIQNADENMTTTARRGGGDISVSINICIGIGMATAFR